MSDDWYKPTAIMTATTIRAHAAIIQLPLLLKNCPIPITQSEPTAKRPSSICSEIKFTALPIQRSDPRIKASNPARLKTMDAVRITIAANV